ncbi:hypothetical protein Micbo1qcDRAFT_209399 [Microdochium bolleyi]|uniref:Uncharacterized protein n=1 Tax=Microdochium bolleyi TaxID=196109 RepID=A0A136IM25_9PEZI|nr:hypothetical protein Micbo1qcDRAFT_209399 [Microdochium bolleyi]
MATAAKGVAVSTPEEGNTDDRRPTAIPGWAIGLISMLGFVLALGGVLVWHFSTVERVRRDFGKPFRYWRVLGQALLCVTLVTPVRILLNKMGALHDCCGGLCTVGCMRQKLLEEEMEMSTRRSREVAQAKK